MQTKHYFIAISCVILLAMLSACGFTIEHNEDESEESMDENLTGIMLAGEELPEQVGLLKSYQEPDEVIITVADKDITYRLSEDAKGQLLAEQVVLGSEVTFSTYSIGDEVETIERFKQ